MKHDKPPEEHHKQSEKRLVSGEIKIHGAIQVFDTPDEIEQHKTERAEDNSYKDSTKNFEKSYLNLMKVTALISFLYLTATILIFLQSKRAADAAKQAANTAQQQLEASQGASINFNVIVSGPFVFDSDGIKLQPRSTIGTSDIRKQLK